MTHARALFAAGLIVLALPACIPGESKLPTATATLRGAMIDLPRASYCWSSGGHATCADSAGAEQLLKSGYLKPYRTTGGFDTTVEFQSDSPAQSFAVQLLQSPSGQRAVESEGQTFHVDATTQSGVYVYVVTGKWSQGDVGFFLALELVPGPA